MISSSPVTQLELEFNLTNDVQPRVIIQSNEINLGEFTVPLNRLLIVKNLPMTSLSDLKITINDYSVNVQSLTFSG